VHDDPLPYMSGRVHPDELPQRRADEHAEDRYGHLGPAVHHGRTERAGQLGATDRAAEEADQREEPDDGAAAVTAHAIGDRGQQDDDVENVHGRTISFPVWFCAAWIEQMNE
jgi:hypothetical protein